MIPRKYFVALERKVRASDLSPEQAEYILCLLFELAEGLANTRGASAEADCYHPSALTPVARRLIASLGKQGGYSVEFEDHLEKNVVVIHIS